MIALIYLLIFMPMAAALLSYLIGRRSKSGRDLFMSLAVVAEFVLSLSLHTLGWGDHGVISLPGICGMGLHFTLDGFRAIYVSIACFMWMMTGLLSPEYFAHYRNRNRYYFFNLITLGATVAIFLSADLYTTFIFFELMSLASYVWVAQDEKPAALRAAGTYLAVAVMGGMALLMGLFLLYHETGTLMIDALPQACAGKNLYPAAICMFVGFGAKAGAFPMHIWLPKAHPVAPAPASSLLSGILTKTGIFGLLVISCKMLLHDGGWSTFILLVGVITMFLGALLALFSVDFKRTLACSSVSQIGFILVGLGMFGLLGEENGLAMQGTFLHMMNHSLFKLVLFLTAAVIFMNTHKLDLNEIRGFGRKKPLLGFCFLMGALGIGGIPMWSGYISKTLIHESIVEYIHGLHEGHFIPGLLNAGNMKAIEWIFLISGGLTLAYMCKLFVAVFVEKNEDPEVQRSYDEKKPYMNRISAAALTVSAAVIPYLGASPHETMDHLSDLAQSFFGVEHAEHVALYFNWINVKGCFISLCVGTLVYVLAVRGWMMQREPGGAKYYVNRWPAFLDLEEAIYRPVLLRLLPGVLGTLCRIMDGFVDVLAKALIAIGGVLAGIADIFVDGIVVLLRKTVYRDSPKHGELEEGNALTHSLGLLLNSITKPLHKTLWRDREVKRDFEHWLVLKYAAFKENLTVIGRSLSYGLVLFCLGLCATLLYLLISAFLR